MTAHRPKSYKRPFTYDPNKVSRSWVEDDGLEVFVCYPAEAVNERAKRFGAPPQEETDA